MKSTVFTLLLTLTSYCAIAQLQVESEPKHKTIGIVKRAGNFIAQLEYLIQQNNIDTTYILTFKNFKYYEILDLKHITFSNKGDAVDSFYKILKAVFLPENKKNKEYKVHFKLGSTEVIVENNRTMGLLSALVLTTDGYCWLTENQIDNLFGRKE